MAGIGNAPVVQAVVQSPPVQNVAAAAASQENNWQYDSSLASAADPACGCFESFIQAIKDFFTSLLSYVFGPPPSGLVIDMQADGEKDLHATISTLPPEELTIDRFKHAYTAAKRLVLKEGKTDALEALLANRHLFAWKDGINHPDHCNETAALIEEEVANYVKSVLEWHRGDRSNKPVAFCHSGPHAVAFWKIIGKYAQSADRIIACVAWEGLRFTSNHEPDRNFVGLIQSILDSTTNTINRSTTADFLDCHGYKNSLTTWIATAIQELTHRHSDFSRRYHDRPSVRFLSDVLFAIAKSGRIDLAPIESNLFGAAGLKYPLIPWILMEIYHEILRDTRIEEILDSSELPFGIPYSLVLLKRLYNEVPHLSNDGMQLQELRAAICLFENRKHGWEFHVNALNFSEDSDALLNGKPIGSKFYFELFSAFPNSCSNNPYLKAFCLRLYNNLYKWSELSRRHEEYLSLINRLFPEFETRSQEPLKKRIAEIFQSVYPNINATLFSNLSDVIIAYTFFGLEENGNWVSVSGHMNLPFTEPDPVLPRDRINAISNGMRISLSQ